MTTLQLITAREVMSYVPCFSGWQRFEKLLNEKALLMDFLFPTSWTLQTCTLDDVLWLLGRQGKKELLAKFLETLQAPKFRTEIHRIHDYLQDFSETKERALRNLTGSGFHIRYAAALTGDAAWCLSNLHGELASNNIEDRALRSDSYTPAWKAECSRQKQNLAKLLDTGEA